MREDYELSKLKVKRRGPLPGLETGGERPPKVRITIALDQDLIDHFKSEAAKPGVGRAEAHRRAMLALLDDADKPYFAHPLFWAPFVVVGEGGVVDR